MHYMNSKLKILKKRLYELRYVSSASSLLHWDSNVYIPKNGVSSRAITNSLIDEICHKKLLKLDDGHILTELVQDLPKLSLEDAAIVREAFRNFDRSRKFPSSFIKRLSQLSTKAHHVWKEARDKKDFSIYSDILEEMVSMQKEAVDLLGYEDHPYNALIDDYEPGMTVSKLDNMFNGLKEFLVPFIRKVTSKDISWEYVIDGKFPISKQIKLNEDVLSVLGYDFSSGRLDVSTHPFTIDIAPYDVRITTRYSKKDLLYALYSSIHEGGHGIYGQGIPVEYFGVGIGHGASLGIHESQSRMYENLLGRSMSFINLLHKYILKYFPDFNKSPEDLYKIVNHVSLGYIRTESDEVTYNLHIILRYEIEKDLICGNINVKNLPEVWNAKMKEYLGVQVPSDDLGVLQDVHWSSGNFGYFPTYSIGNIYSAQIYNTMLKDIPELKGNISSDTLKSMKGWLYENIHKYGRIYPAEDLITRVTGEGMNPMYFNKYIEDKYTSLYELN